MGLHNGHQILLSNDHAQGTGLKLSKAESLLPEEWDAAVPQVSG